MASQCLGALLAALPLVRRALTPHLPGKQSHLLGALDVLARDLDEHRREIFAKLVGILADLVDKAAARLAAAVAAAARAPLDSLRDSVFDVDAGVARLLDSTRLLHRALSGLLARAERDQIFRSIAAAFSACFAEQLGALAKDERDAAGAGGVRGAALPLAPAPAGGNSNAQLIRRKMITVNCRFIITELRKLDGVEATACKELERFAQ